MSLLYLEHKTKYKRIISTKIERNKAYSFKKTKHIQMFR
jgi:hypothetical protein